MFAKERFTARRYAADDLLDATALSLHDKPCLEGPTTL